MTKDRNVKLVAVGTKGSGIGAVVRGDSGLWLYVTRLPKPGEIPLGMVLVHNAVWPASRTPDVRGSRWWFQSLNKRLKVCTCGVAKPTGRHYCYAKTPSKAQLRANAKQVRQGRTS